MNGVKRDHPNALSTIPACCSLCTFKNPTAGEALIFLEIHCTGSESAKNVRK
jgi:hypothetical protein